MKIEGSRVVALAVVVVILLVCAFLIGEKLGQRAMLRRATVELNGVQAMLAFNRVQDERHVQELMSQGCTAQAEEFIGYTNDKNMELLSGFVQGRIDSGTLKYIADRDSRILVELKTFKSRYGNAWMEKPCKPS
jgi:hypothetical protein